MDDNVKVMEEIRNIREDIVYIKTMLENIVNNVDLKIGTLDEKIKVANNRIQDLKDNNKWLWRTVMGGLIVAILALVLKVPI